MKDGIPTREEAWILLKEYNEEDFHLKHAQAVEAVLRHVAQEKNLPADEVDFWGVVGLLHDVDFERFPDEHCTKAREILEGKGMAERVIHAVVSHGYGIVSDTKPEHEMEKVLFAADELTGLISAVAIMRPSKSLMDLPVKSVMKKFKTPSFAAGCSRDVIRQGAEMLDMEVPELVEKTIAGMRTVAAELGLAG